MGVGGPDGGVEFRSILVCGGVRPAAVTDIDPLEAFRQVLATEDKIAIGGGPNVGKTTVFGAMVDDRPVVHTDDWIKGGPKWQPGMGWNEVPHAVAREVWDMPRVVVEGIRAVGVIRAGWVPDILVWLHCPLIELTPKQESTRQGRETDFGKWLIENEGRIKVLRLWRPRLDA